MLPSLLLGHRTHEELQELLRASRHIIVSGLANETAKAMLLSHLLSFGDRRVLLVTENTTRDEALRHWLHFFEHEALVLHPTEVQGVISPEGLRSFLLLMQEQRGTRITIATRDLWGMSFPLYRELLQRRLILRKGENIQFMDLFESLLERGYRHGEDLHLTPGEYRRTGDILDIYPIQSHHPIRVLFDFETVAQILHVSTGNLSETHDGGEKIDILPVQYERTLPLYAQLPSNLLLILDDQDETDPPVDVDLLRFTAFPESRENHVHLRYLSVLKFYTLTDFLNDVRDKLQQEWRLVVITKRMEELRGILAEERIAHTTEQKSRPGAVTLISAEETDLLPHSLQNPDLRCALLTDREIFSLKKMGKQRSVAKLALDFVTSLQPGDYVVHMEHGIGHFEGMTQKVIDDVPREYLELTYAEGDKLFIPVDQADKLSKFVHEEGEEPELTRLGTVEWKHVTEKMRMETLEIARGLLNLYAKRARTKGFAFREDTAVQREFEDAFPYEETPGQHKAIQDIKEDMERDQPMDRLICGDVGFGKTEVAMRAAFKAVQGGKQVAVIAPITILADQHYRNFRERMKGFPVRIDMLSRFRTPKEQEETLRKLRKGDIDVVIGTHRLLQNDVKFLNLGLVVVDEEQRFGVKQKERFKEMRSSVDILTLTATPIPRTLNLGLHKLRDITTITTPPPGRLPIITEVRKFSDELVWQAIKEELRRKGQVFVLHNRVETIDAFADKLRMLVPEARFVVGHGQLPADELEKRILDFKEGEYDVLVSSTIIENGIDLPRANTLIVNEAEHFGLAQLYQLRGRVGRSKLQAYAYFLYHSQKLKDDAKKRLRAIVEACELGSGFQVAMRDLEIRGAGEILGASQSGTMQTVGVSHYLRMLKAAVEELRSGKNGVAVGEEVPVEIQIPVEAYLPSFYIPDEQEKISVYQKLAGSEEEAILEEFAADLRDEYGEPPAQVENLFHILRLKMACRETGVQRIKAEETTGHEHDVVLTLSPGVTAKEIMQLIAENPAWKISGSTLRITERMIREKAGADHWLDVLREDVLLLKKKRNVRGKNLKTKK